MARLQAFAALLVVTLLGSAVPAVAQTPIPSAALSGINGPTFVALDTVRGFIYVSEHGEVNGTLGGRIMKFPLAGGAGVAIAVNGTTDGAFISPDAILVDATTGDLTIADRFLNRVQRITNTGVFVMKFGSVTVGATDEMHGPVGLATDSDGAIYVTEHGETTGTIVDKDRVAKYTITGIPGPGAVVAKSWRTLGGTGEGDGQFKTPYGIAVSGTSVYISDGFNNGSRVQVLSTVDGTYQSQFSVGVTGINVIPLGLFIDSANALWITQSSDGGTGPLQRVEKRTLAGVATGTAFGSPGTGDGQFSLPFHTVVDLAANRAYVADYNNDRVQIFDLSIDSAPAVIASFGLGASNTTTVNFNLVFNEAVTGVVASSFTTNLTGGATGVVGTPTGSGTTWSIPVTFGGPPGGTISLTAKAAGSGINDLASNPYAGGGAATSAIFTVPGSGGTGGPSVSTFAYVRSTLTFRIVFNEDVTGVDVTDFEFEATGSAGGSLTSVAPDNGSATAYILTISYDGGQPGSIQLRIKPTGTGITGTSGAFTGAGVASAIVPVSNNTDVSIPTVSTFTPGSGSGSLVDFTVTFSEPVMGIERTDVSSILTGSAAATIGIVRAANASGTVYIIPVTYTGTGSIQLQLAGGTDNIEDGNYNDFAGGTNGLSQVFTIPGTAPAAPVISGASSGAATTGTAFSYQITATGSPTGYALASGSLPALITLNTSTGLVSGTANTGTAGTYPVTFTATNGTGTSAAFSYTLTVTAAGAAPVISGASSGAATTGTAFSYQITATGSPTGYALASGSLPALITLNTSTGLVSGTANAGTAGTYPVTFTATNGTGTSTAFSYTLTVSAPTLAPTIANVTAPANGIYRAAQTLSFTTTFSEAVTVTGTPRIALVIGSTTRQAAYISGSGTTALVFSYTIIATDIDANGIAITPASIDLNGGTIRNSSTTNATLTFTAPVTTGVLVDTTTPLAPVISAITDDTGTTTDFITSDTTLLFSGTAEVGSTVTLTRTGTGVIGTATAAAVTGAWSVDYTATALTAGTYTFTATATDAAGNVSSASATRTVTIQTAIPVVTASTFSGTAGTAASFALVATNGPTGYALVSGTVPTGMSFNTTAGTIAGTPSAAGASSITVTATNTVGTSPVVAISFNIAAAPIVNPPGGGGGLPPVNPPIAKTNQTITLTAPAGTVFVDQAVVLSTTSTSNLAVTLMVISGDATLSGSSITIASTDPVVIRASQSGDNSYNAATSVDLSLTASKRSQSITFAALSGVPATTANVALNATSSAGLPIVYSVSGPATLSGSTLTLNGTAGIVSVTAAQAGNHAYTAAASIVRTFAVQSVGTQVFFGTMGDDPFAATVSADGTTGMFITQIASTGQGIIAHFTVNSAGAFSAQTIAPAAVANIANGFFLPPTAAAGETYTVSGTLTNGVLSGTIAELGTSFTANVQPSVGSTAALAGVYTASVPGSASGETYIIVGPTGEAFAVAITSTGATSGTGTISADGTVNIATANGGSINGHIDPASGAISGTVTNAGTTSAFTGLGAGTETTARLVNLSSRLSVVAGDNSRSVIAGFYVSGTEAKRVLIRAVGPGLTAFGVGGALSNPKLQLFRGDTMVAENDDWNNSAEIGTTGDSVGAFQLGASSRDSALVATLEAGGYTAIVTGVSSNGVVLIEVYDANSNTSLAAQQLVNISTRGFVDTGEGSLIAGFVITGNAPKKVLIRGIGPSLTQFGVTGAVADPALKLYAAGSVAVIAQNDDWSVAQPINAAQTAATGVEVSVASLASGAFPLAAGSKDAAIVTTLMPGNYSAVVSGAGTTTGAGLVEVYEISDR